MVDKLASLVERLEVAVARQEALAGSAPSEPSKQQEKSVDNKTAKEYIGLITAKVENLKKATADLNIA